MKAIPLNFHVYFLLVFWCTSTYQVRNLDKGLADVFKLNRGLPVLFPSQNYSFFSPKSLLLILSQSPKSFAQFIGKISLILFRSTKTISWVPISRGALCHCLAVWCVPHTLPHLGLSPLQLVYMFMGRARPGLTQALCKGQLILVRLGPKPGPYSSFSLWPSASYTFFLKKKILKRLKINN